MVLDRRLAEEEVTQLSEWAGGEQVKYSLFTAFTCPKILYGVLLSFRLSDVFSEAFFWLVGCPYLQRVLETAMIIFVLTFAIISLFALTLTGSIASTATVRRRS